MTRKRSWASPQSSTRALVKAFMKNPGSEHSLAEFKRGEKLDTAEGRAKIVEILSAMANSGGHTMIVGIGREANQTVLQNISSGSEAIRDLTNLIRSRTHPKMHELLSMRWETVDGHRLLRLDVKGARVLTHFRNDRRDWEAYVRVGGTTRVMTAAEAYDFARRQTTLDDNPHCPLPDVEVKGRLPVVRWNPLPEWPLRFATECEWDSQVVFVDSIPFYTSWRQGLVHLRTDVSFDHTAHWRRFLEHARDTFQFHEGWGFRYSIKVHERLLCGATLPHFLHDVEKIEAVGHRLLGLRGREPGEDRRFLPLATGAVSIGNGLLWFEAEYRGDDSWAYGKCGLIFPEYPFDQQYLVNFFKEVGSVPPFYEFLPGVQGFRLVRSKGALRHPSWFQLEPGEDSLDYLAADNPVYGRAAALSSGDWTVENRLRGFASVPRVPFQVVGGYGPNAKRFSLKFIEGLCVGMRSNTTLVDPMAFDY